MLNKYHIIPNWREIFQSLRSKPIVEAYEELYKKSNLRNELFDSIQGEEYKLNNAIKAQQESLRKEILKYKTEYEEFDLKLQQYEMGWMAQITSMQEMGVEQAAQQYKVLKGTTRMISTGIRRDEDVLNHFIQQNERSGGKDYTYGITKPHESREYLLTKKEYWKGVLDTMDQLIQQCQLTGQEQKDAEKKLIEEEKHILLGNK